MSDPSPRQTTLIVQQQLITALDTFCKRCADAADYACFLEYLQSLQIVAAGDDADVAAFVAHVKAYVAFVEARANGGDGYDVYVARPSRRVASIIHNATFVDQLLVYLIPTECRMVRIEHTVDQLLAELSADGDGLLYSDVDDSDASVSS